MAWIADQQCLLWRLTPPESDDLSVFRLSLRHFQTALLEMRRSSGFYMVLGLVFLAGAASSEIVQESHPSLIACPDAFKRLRDSEDPVTRKVLHVVRGQAEAQLAEPVVVRELEGRRMLDVSRRALGRLMAWGLMHQLDGDAQWAARAEKELMAIAAFEDWNPGHFLDVAEMAAGVSIALDWFGNALPLSTQAILREALVTHALEPAQAGEHWWKTGDNNWNQVCYGGLILAALTVRETYPGVAETLLQEARRNLHHGLHAYAPEGVYPEGPMYWSYGTVYTVVTIEALRRKLGTDWDLPRAPGFVASGDFMTHVFGPTGEWVNFADCWRAKGSLPLLPWFAREAKDPGLAWIHFQRLPKVAAGETRADRWLVPGLLWRDLAGEPGPPRETSWFGNGPNPIAFHRLSWDDPDTAFVSLKAGSGQVNHGHLDAGTFVFEVLGVRWAIEADMQPYHSVEKLGMVLWNKENGSDRWSLFRLNNFSHNTLTIDEKLHDATGVARMQRHGPGVSVVEFSQPLGLKSAQRGVWLMEDQLWIRDELDGLTPGTPITWNWLTAAGIEIAGREVRLTQEGKTLSLQVHGSGPGQWKIVEINSLLADYDEPIPGHRLLQWQTTAEGSGQVSIPVTARWESKTRARTPEPLARWPGSKVRPWEPAIKPTPGG